MPGSLLLRHGAAVRTPRRAVFGEVVQVEATMYDGCSFACIHHRAQIHECYTILYRDCQIARALAQTYCFVDGLPNAFEQIIMSKVLFEFRDQRSTL